MPSNYVMLPYELDSINTNTLPTNQMACMLVGIDRPLFIDAIAIASSSGANANLVGCGLYDPRTLSLLVGVSIPFTLAISASGSQRSVSLVKPFFLSPGCYVWAAGATSGGSPSVGSITPLAHRANLGLFGRSPVGVSPDANGNPPGNLQSITQVGAVTQMLVGWLLGR